MKLYCWRAKSYAEEAFVIAESEEHAKQILLSSKLPEPKSPRPEGPVSLLTHELWRQWWEHDYRNRVVDLMLSLEEHEFVVLEPGEMAWAEQS